MDTKKSNVKNDIDELLKLLELPKDELKVQELSKPIPNAFDDILEQRKKQRERVLSSISRLMWSSFWLLVVLLFWQSLIRTFSNSTFTLLDGFQLQILSVSIFGQVIAVVVIISKALWDDKIYMDRLKK